MNIARWESINKSKICGIDIDGVLADYPKCWVDFVNAELAESFENLDVIKDSLSYNVYRALKDKYRSSGYKRYLPVVDGASEFTQELKKKDYEIVVLTKRPFARYPSLQKMTIDWLKNNDIAFDSIIDSRQKHLSILQRYPKLKFMVEDNLHIANQVAQWNYKVYVLKNKYNTKKEKVLSNNVVLVDKLKDILEKVE